MYTHDHHQNHPQPCIFLPPHEIEPNQPDPDHQLYCISNRSGGHEVARVFRPMCGTSQGLFSYPADYFFPDGMAMLHYIWCIWAGQIMHTRADRFLVVLGWWLDLAKYLPNMLSLLGLGWSGGYVS